tara:strand:- start:62 stop:1228 length:1167 start_codon:yes stop_codon:yes gene_type:complete
VKITKIYFLIIFISVGFSLYLSEVYLNYKKDSNSINILKKQKIYKKEKNKDFDIRSKSQIYEDMSENDPNITSEASPSLFNDPDKKLFFLNGISKSKTISCNENGYYSIYQSDRYGFNNPDKEWDEKEIEYLLVGDSFTAGSCVNRPNDITSILRILSNKSALNLGYKGNGPLASYATLKEYKPKKIKNILWLYFEGNDLSNLEAELGKKILKNYFFNENFNQNLNQKQEYIDIQNQKLTSMHLKKQDEAINYYKKNSALKYKLLKFIRLDKTKKKIKSFLKKKEKELPIQEFENILFRTKELAAINNSNFYFIYLPQYERYTQKINNKNYTNVRSIIKKLNINFIDLHEELFIKEKNPLELFPFKMWGHYNELGYKKVAEKIYLNLK